MATIKGTVLSADTILTQYGLEEPFKTNLRSGAQVWLHYKNRKLVTVECKEELRIFRAADLSMGNGE